MIITITQKKIRRKQYRIKRTKEKRREDKETKKVGEKVSNLSIDKLLSMLTPEQIAAIKSA